MSIVVDVNAIVPVFNENDLSHKDFAPVREWIIKGRGRLVFGGTKYKAELKKTIRYARLIRRLKDAGKACEVHQDMVDEREREIVTETVGTDCDDQHLIAILSVSGCLLFCSQDRRADKFITDRRWYSKGRRRPRIYRSIKNRNLLSQRFLVKLQHLV
ncbi:MAG: hypothetical protein EA424_10900 [Planctomycetaceae bacterium]|nr:MAG: hypothetical protein EA424_10900 [Planctomycetaceae bacterium]